MSRKYGAKSIWPGDTLGLSSSGGHAIFSWGSADEIYATRTTLPGHRS